VHSSYTFTAGSAVFDKLVSAAGLVPVLELAEQTGLSELIGEHVDLPSTRVKSGAVNPAGKLTSIVAGMMCGADSIDDANVLRASDTPRVSTGRPGDRRSMAAFGAGRLGPCARPPGQAGHRHRPRLQA